jgi:hypothetical protein
MENRNSDSYYGIVKFMLKHIPSSNPPLPSRKVNKTKNLKTLTYLREEQISGLQGLPKPLTVIAFQPESYLILPIKPKICKTEFLISCD